MRATRPDAALFRQPGIQVRTRLPHRSERLRPTEGVRLVEHLPNRPAVEGGDLVEFAGTQAAGIGAAECRRGDQSADVAHPRRHELQLALLAVDGDSAVRKLGEIGVHGLSSSYLMRSRW